MSRIDEALKRASGGVAEQSREKHQAHTRAANEALLEQYPREGRGSFREDAVAAFAREEPAQPPASVRVPVPVPRRRVADVRQMPTKAPARPSRAAFDSKLITGAAASPMLVEQFRRLAASMHELQLERGLKTLTVTSAVPREGKSLTVANLALTLSESYGKRVLLVDADLRRPSIHELFGLTNVSGLSDLLQSQRTDLPIQPVTESLSVLPAGLPQANPLVGLTSDRMRALLDEAAAEFDWVLLDAPPVAVMPDAALLSGMTRAIVLVIAAGSTPYAQVGRAISELGREYIVGTVLNRIEDGNIPDTSFYRPYHDLSPAAG